ncbi:MAG: epoxide hydrolase N-terminal domain-containing protein, partial [Xanthobacteraceae bacterium]
MSATSLSPTRRRVPVIAAAAGAIGVFATTLRAAPEDNAIRRFHINVPEQAIIDLGRRIAATPWPAREAVTDQSRGVHLTKIPALVTYWGTGYGWRKVEATLNALPMLMTEIDGLDIQFIHVRSCHPNAVKLIITYGWPGSILGLLKVLDLLTDPASHGGRATDAFDLVLLSMPGYGFPEQPHGTGWGPDRIARAWAVMMECLRCWHYVSQAGDWESVISDVMARQAPAGLLGIDANMPAAVPADVAGAVNNDDPAPAGMSGVKTAAFDSPDIFYKKNCGGGAMMVTRPQTVGYGLSDSPVGLAARIYAKFAQWTYSGGELERSLAKDEMLDDI